MYDKYKEIKALTEKDRKEIFDTARAIAEAENQAVYEASIKIISQWPEWKKKYADFYEKSS